MTIALKEDVFSDTSSGDEEYHDDSFTEKEDLLAEARRLEDQDVPTPKPGSTQSIRTKVLFLAAYFILNLTLTLSNKAVLGKARFPWLLTTLHATATAFGCFVLVGLGHLQLTHLSTRDHVKLTAFSFLFTLNIAMSNVSLGLVSVPFHQVMRSTCPIVTILIIRVLYGKEYSIKTYLSMIPLVLGVALATARDYHFSMLGFVLTLAGVVLASVKTVATNRLMTGSLALSAPEVLLRMSPLAAVQCLVYAFFVGEVDQVRENYAAGGLPSPMFAAALVLNASFALLLNFVSFQTNKIAGPLTMSICGNAKQVLTIALGILLFNVQVGPSGYCGLLIALGGAAWYSKTELESRASKTPG